MKNLTLVLAASVPLAFVLYSGCTLRPEGGSVGSEPPHVTAASDVEAGRYLAIVGGCNDCHTDNYMFTEGNVPEEDWLTGSPIGFRGPWGTTYPANLRLTVQEKTEDEFVQLLATRKALPPMPWMNVNKMSTTDARMLYRYLRSLGPKGEKAHVTVAPDQEPATPFILLVPQNLPQ